MKITMYAKKRVYVQAFQLTPERRNDSSDWPEWLNNAIKRKALTLDEVPENGWVVREVEGNPCIFRDDQFRRSFDILDHEVGS